MSSLTADARVKIERLYKYTVTLYPIIRKSSPSPGVQKTLLVTTGQLSAIIVQKKNITFTPAAIRQM